MVAGSNNFNPESPTTARPLDFDDEPQETGVTPAPTSSAPPQPAEIDTLPPKPPRPLSPKQQAENTLREAFPTVDAAVARAVLVASNYNVERAFHALLGWSSRPNPRYQ
jgi:CUE domain